VRIRVSSQASSLTSTGIRTQLSTLYLLIDDEQLGRLVSIRVKLLETIEESVSHYIDPKEADPDKLPSVLRGRDAIANLKKYIGPYISVLLYLCAGNAETRPTRDCVGLTIVRPSFAIEKESSISLRFAPKYGRRDFISGPRSNAHARGTVSRAEPSNHTFAAPITTTFGWVRAKSESSTFAGCLRSPLKMEFASKATIHDVNEPSH